MAVISVTVAWWYELLTYWFLHASLFFWLDLLVVLISSIIVVAIKLRLGYVNCSCGIDGYLQQGERAGHFERGNGLKRGLITDHPDLPTIIATSFGWKRVKVCGFSAICTGRSIVSLPHFSYGSFGALSEDARSREYLFTNLSKLHFVKGFYGIEWRYPEVGAMIGGSDTEKEVLKGAVNKVVSWIKLPEQKEALWRGFSSNLRRKIGKASRHRYEVLVGGEEFLSAFMKVYERRMYEMGSASLTPVFFRNLIRQYKAPGRVDVWILKEEGVVVGGGINIGYGLLYENCWFATVGSARDHYGSYLLQWHMISHAIELGYTLYSFGRSTKGSGVHRFKLQWGAEDVALSWVSWPEVKGGIRSQKWLSWVWRHVPYRLAVYVGRSIAKWIY